jgi:DNA-binding NtrC family response regulator
MSATTSAPAAADTSIQTLSTREVLRHLDAEGTEQMIDGRTSLWDMVRQSVVQTERAILLRALRHTGGNKAGAARLLQIDYKTMRYKTKGYGLSFDKGDNGHERRA